MTGADEKEEGTGTLPVVLRRGEITELEVVDDCIGSVDEVVVAEGVMEAAVSDERLIRGTGFVDDEASAVCSTGASTLVVETGWESIAWDGFGIREVVAVGDTGRYAERICSDSFVEVGDPLLDPIESEAFDDGMLTCAVGFGADTEG